MKPKLQLQHIVKAFKGHIILDDVSLTAYKGDVIALMGSSGSGKSTLLRCMNLLTIPEAGNLQLNDQKIIFTDKTKMDLSAKEISQLRTKIGMVFQDFNLWTHKTILENLIEAPIHVLKQNPKMVIEEAQQLIEKVGLTNKLNQYPHQLSGGQQQRAAIARALMMHPEIMLFDEPTSALDPGMVGDVMQVLQALAKEGMTMIIATHEVGFAKRIANEVIFLDEGKIVEQGSVETLFSQPKNPKLVHFLKAIH